MSFLNTTMESRILSVWPTDAPIRTLAKEFGCSESYVSQLAKKLGLPSRASRLGEIRRNSTRARFDIKVKAALENKLYFENEAALRGIGVRALEQLLIKTILNDRLVSAIMDDEDELRLVA